MISEPPFGQYIGQRPQHTGRASSLRRVAAWRNFYREDYMSDDLIQKLRNSPPREICEHGSQRVKCDHCDNERLEIENERLRELADAWCDQHQRDSAELRNLCLARDEARAELAALRARIDRGFVMAATKNGVIRTGTNAFNPGKRVALVQLDD